MYLGYLYLEPAVVSCQVSLTDVDHIKRQGPQAVVFGAFSLERGSSHNAVNYLSFHTAERQISIVSYLELIIFIAIFFSF